MQHYFLNPWHQVFEDPLSVLVGISGMLAAFHACHCGFGHEDVDGDAVQVPDVEAVVVGGGGVAITEVDAGAGGIDEVEHSGFGVGV